MPDISQQLAAIDNALYGEEVRLAIHDALAVMNQNIDESVPDNSVSTNKIQSQAVTIEKLSSEIRSILTDFELRISALENPSQS